MVQRVKHSFGCLGWAVVLTLLGPLLIAGACAALTALGVGITLSAPEHTGAR